MAINNLVFLDSNILMRYVTQGKSGCEESLWEELQHLASQRKVRFLLPEVVVLEFEKITDNLEYQIESGTQKLRKAVSESITSAFDTKRGTVWNELRDAEPFLLEKFDEWKKAKSVKCRLRREQINQWLKSPSTNRLPLDNDLVFRTKKRAISGRYPGADTDKSFKYIENDCLIMDSLISFFETAKSGTNRLQLCTENLNDFAVDIGLKHTNNVHPKFKTGLPDQSIVFSDLASLLEFARKPEDIELPKKDAVETALEENRARLARESQDNETFIYLDNLDLKEQLIANLISDSKAATVTVTSLPHIDRHSMVYPRNPQMVRLDPPTFLNYHSTVAPVSSRHSGVTPNIERTNVGGSESKAPSEQTHPESKPQNDK